MIVYDVMNKHVVTISPEESARQAAKLLFRYNIGSVPVVAANGRLRGIVTDRDILLRCIAADSDPDDTPVSEIMTRSMITAAPDTEIPEAARRMSVGQVRRLPVVDGGRLVGMLSLADIARSRPVAMEAGAALSEISAGVVRK
ncbi:MAG: CBS domain-containing protein [Oscillospiraceae bacterium]|nr:CBS domain-containing protein [Oscillospiraceae bacterium]